MKFSIKLFFLVIFTLTTFFSYKYIKQHTSYNYKEPNIEEMVRAKTENNYLDKKIQSLIKEKKFNEIDAYINLAKEFHIKLLPQTKELIKQNFTTSKKIKRGFKEFVKGFISGKANSGTEVAGAITSDFTVYGDLRDIKKEGEKYINNQPYDKLILGLSITGLALSGSQFVTLGTSSSLKVGTSALKVAKRENLITKSFSNVLTEKLDKSINFNSLKNIKINSIANIKKSAKIIKNSVNLKPLKPIFKNLKTIKSSTSLTDTIKLMKYVDNEKELKSVAKLSKRYKKGTLGIFKIFGKNSFRLIKAGIKWGDKLILSVVAFGLSIFGFIISLYRLVFK